MESLASTALVALGVTVVGLLLVQVCGTVARRGKSAEADVPLVPHAPGQSLLAPIVALEQKAGISRMAVFAGAGLFLCGHLLLSYFAAMPESAGRAAISAGGALLFSGSFAWRWRAASKRLRRKRRLLDGRVAVARALEPLAAKGHDIFHDFAAEPFTISHIVVGPLGVLIVDTQAPSASGRRRSDPEPVVRYDGRMLHFPGNSDHEIIDRANQQAAWLAEWLSQIVQTPVYARAIVAIPGWHVKRTSAEGIPVVNPGQFATLFDHLRPYPLEEEMRRSIVQQLQRHYDEMAVDGERQAPRN